MKAARVPSFRSTERDRIIFFGTPEPARQTAGWGDALPIHGQLGS